MAIANLVLEYLKVLAWPIVAIVVALLFRTSVAALLNRLKTVEAEGLGFKFKGTDQTAAEVERSQAKSQKPASSSKRRSVPPTNLPRLPTRSESVEACIEALVESGVHDPNLNLFLGVFRNDTEMVKEAIAAGADVNLTDTQVLNMHAASMNDEKVKSRARELALQKAERRASAESPDAAVTPGSQ